jgi:hypothetical protein
MYQRIFEEFHTRYAEWKRGEYHPEDERVVTVFEGWQLALDMDDGFEKAFGSLDTFARLYAYVAYGLTIQVKGK